MSQVNVRLSAARIGRWPVCATVLLAAAQMIQAQGILGTNLIANPGAEDGPAGTGVPNLVASIPHWTRTGTSNNTNVVPYNLTGYLLLSEPSPPPAERGFNYFVGAGWPSAVTITQDIDVSSGASIISGGNVKFTLSGYLGSASPNDYAGTAQLDVAFKNGSGQTFSSAALGPLDYLYDGMSLQQTIGLVPSGTVKITITLSLRGINGGYGAADDLSLVLSTLGTSPDTLLGHNLIVNPGAEAGPSLAPSLGPSLAVVGYVPGWSTAAKVSVAPYGGKGWVQISDPGPPDRGVNLFCGGTAGSFSYQEIDVSGAAALIDAGQVKYEVSGWLGGLGPLGSPILTYLFFDWSGKQLATTGQFGGTNRAGTGLVQFSHSDVLPAGTRRVQIVLTFPGPSTLADNIAFVLAAPNGPPVITPGGVVSASAFGGFTSIAQGSWIEIYGVNLAGDTRGWSGSDFVNGVAPNSLDGVTVSIGGALAFIDYISPNQIDALVPSNAPTGVQEVTVTNANLTSDGFGIYVDPTQPGLLAPSSFLIGGKQYLAALFADGSFAIPENAIAGVPSHPAKPGDTLIVYGVGFGPVDGGFTAGTVVTQGNSLNTPVQFLFGNTPATASYYGLAPSYTGLYQFNVVVPNVPRTTPSRFHSPSAESRVARRSTSQCKTSAQ